MAASRWVGLAWGAGLVATIFVACSNGATDQASTGSIATEESSASTGGASSSSSSGNGGAGGGSIECKVSYTNVPKGDCDLLQQDCGPGQTCNAVKVKGTPNYTSQCVPGAGLKQKGEICYTDSECESGTLCLINRCTPVCCPDGANIPCAGGNCNFTRSLGKNSNGVLQTFRFCSYGAKCMLFDPNACPPEVGAAPEFCHVSDASQGLATCMPNSGTPVQEGDACAAINDCDGMQNCTGGVCRFLCDFKTGTGKAPGLGGCPAGQFCSASVGFGIPNIGSCLPNGDAGPDDASSDAKTD